jgi:pyrroline-5-carboxylate reductase
LLGRQIERHSVTTDRRDGMLKGKKIGMIGGGKMGGALIGGMVSHKIVPAKDIMVSDVVPERLDELRGRYGVRTTSDNLKLCRESNIIILAIKPQTMATVLGEISQAIDKTKTVISIAAGIPIRLIEDRLKKGVRIIRTMPNTPALVSAGVSALAKSKDATEEDLATARCIFDAVGSSVVVQEDLMDSVTGLSGSGPAYVFIMIEALSDGGVRMGLSRDIALKLSAQTVLGAAKLFLESGKHPGELKDMVTSPGGTTIAGIKALEEGKIRATLMAAVEAATLRSRELGNT